MAKLSTVRTLAGRDRHDLAVDWDYTQVMREVTRLRRLDDDRPKAIAVTGADVREFTTPLVNELRRIGAKLVQGPQDITELFEERVRITRLGIEAFNLSQPMWDVRQIHDASYRAALEDESSAALFQSVLSFEKSFRPDTLREVVSSLSSSLNNRIVVYVSSKKQRYSGFDMILPWLVRRLPSTVWILLGDNEVFDQCLPINVERDYIKWSDIIEVVADLKGVEGVDLRHVLERELPPPPGFSKKNEASIPFREAREYFFYYNLHVKNDLSINWAGIPKPLSAPFEFVIRAGKIFSSKERGDDLKKGDPSSVILKELVSQIDDVLTKFNLHNEAPVLHEKFSRLKITISDLIEDPDRPSIIRAGILSASIKEQIPFETVIAGTPAEGAARSATQQVELFVNRLAAWKEYVWEAGGIDRDRLDSTFAAAKNILRHVLKDRRTVDEKTARELTEYVLKAGSEDAPDIEKEGLVRSTQNLLVKIANYVNEQIRGGIADIPKGVVGDLGKLGVGAGVVSLFVSLEPLAGALASINPPMFSWLDDFVRWVLMALS